MKKFILENSQLLDKIQNDILGLIENCHIQLESTEPDRHDIDQQFKGEIRAYNSVLTMIENLKKGE